MPDEQRDESFEAAMHEALPLFSVEPQTLMTEEQFNLLKSAYAGVDPSSDETFAAKVEEYTNFLAKFTMKEQYLLSLSHVVTVIISYRKAKRDKDKERSG